MTLLPDNRLGRIAGAARQQPDTLIVEGIWPAKASEERRCINTLIGGDPVPPDGGAAFHDTAVWLKALAG